MRSWRRWAVAATAVTAVTLAASGAPRALQHLDAFRVGRVHVTGTEHLSPAAAIAASGISSRSSVFDDFAPWRTALERHPLVLRARVSRRLPATIVLAITESEPIALVSTSQSPSALRPVDARGRVLPIEAARLEHELPRVDARVTTHPSGLRIDTSGVRLVRALARIRETEPWLAAWTSEVAALPDGLRLAVDWPAGAEVLLSAPDADALEAVRLTVLDLARSAKNETEDADSAGLASVAAPDTAAARRPALAAIGVPTRLLSLGAATPLGRLDRVDARFRDQVVVTLREAGDASREERAR